MKLVFLILLIWTAIQSYVQGQYELKGQVKNTEGIAVEDAFLLLEPIGATTSTNAQGKYQFKNLKAGTYTLTLAAEGFQQQNFAITITSGTIQQDAVLDSLSVTFDKDVVVDEKGYHLNPAISGTTLLSAKTIHLIDLEKSLANKANATARELFKTVPGLNIWENDNSGIQLNIGGRGLNPNRTSNFNTRQNGYDISADALGYPETYYTPPAQAVKRIEVLRGAASLQFGTQFGGMLNFVLKKGPEDRAFEFVSENTYGAFNFFNTFNSIGGTVAKGKLNYYAFYQFKRGDGWRPNANFEVHNGYLQLSYRPHKRWLIQAEQTIMQYWAHQPGGLTDQLFETAPRQSIRNRNWFRVNWNISALSITHDFSTSTKLDIRSFLLYASRQSLGNLEAINRPDYNTARNLIKGNYLNIGTEARLVHRYDFLKSTSALVTGVRVYRGSTEQQQGFSNNGDTGNRADFEFSPAPRGILQSNYQFPSFNFAAFAENYFSLNERWSITPGVRLEYIHTAASGYYQDLVVVPSSTGVDTLKNEAVNESRSNGRTIFLAGVGVSYKLNPNLEFYGNISQNYRGINFNDMRIANPNQAVDPNLQDEYGFNADLGIKGSYKGWVNFSATLFYLAYNRRIGNIQSERPNKDNPLIIEPYTLRTNVGNARVLGGELFVEADWWKLILKTNKTPFGLRTFVNASVLDGRYLQTANSFAQGKQLEFVAPVILRTGIEFGYKTFRLAYQYAYTAQHYSDATNATWVPNAVVGVIPSYGVMDLSVSYQYKWLTLQAGINNLADERYFTRRASSYPGPGILPADGRSFYITARITLGTTKVKS